eukprot:GGOE01014668.1.p1 GENE.GGOE01014668.1~~GGOE01014668.1.p1  ORF type:complete len:574 (-),score=171.49 GGOE01014668.1:85-1755(-)
MSAELVACLVRLGYTEPMHRGALDAAFECRGARPLLRYFISRLQGGDCISDTELQEFSALQSAGAVREGTALEAAVLTHQREAEALRSLGDQLSSEVAELEEQVHTERGRTSKCEARLHTLQACLAGLQQDTEVLAAATGTAAAAHLNPARESFVIAGRQLEQSFQQLGEVAHQLLDAQMSHHLATGMMASQGNGWAQQAFACLNQSDSLGRYHTEVLEAIEAGLGRLCQELEGHMKLVEEGELARLQQGWAVGELQREIAEVHLKQATAVNQRLLELCSARDTAGGQEWQTKQTHKEEAELSDAVQQLRQLVLAVGPLHAECQVMSGENSARTALMEHCLARLDAMHQALCTLQSVEEQCSQQLDREEQHMAACEEAMTELSTCLAASRSQHQRRGSVYAQLDAVHHRGHQLQAVDEALKLAATDAPDLPRSLAEHLAHTLTHLEHDSQRCTEAEAAARKGASSLEGVVATLMALREQPHRLECLAGLQALQTQVQEMTAGIADIRDYQGQHQSTRSSEERQLWPLLFTNRAQFLETLKDFEVVAEAQGSLAQYL